MSHHQSILSWLARPTQVKRTFTDLIGLKTTTVRVTRTPESENNVGFDNELDSNVYYETFEARLDLSRSSGSEDMVGLTEYKDVRKNDRWLCDRGDGKPLTLQVVRIAYRDNGGYEVGLKYE